MRLRFVPLTMSLILVFAIQVSVTEASNMPSHA